MPKPDPRLYYGRAAVLQRLAQQAHETANQHGNNKDKREVATVNAEAILSDMSLALLADHCMRAIEKYRNKEPYNDQYCLEIFHRAMVKHDPDAWELLQKRFSPIVRAWMHKHPQREIACRFEPEENYIANTFTRLWQASLVNTVKFDTMATALRYLKLCLQGAIMDNLRTYNRPKETPLLNPSQKIYEVDDSTTEDDHESQEIWEGPTTEDDHESQEMWEAIKNFLPNERERRLAYLLYRCGLKSREIVRLLPDEFSDVQEIYRLSINIKSRLMINRDQLRYLLSDGGL